MQCTIYYFNKPIENVLVSLYIYICLSDWNDWNNCNDQSLWHSLTTRGQTLITGASPWWSVQYTPTSPQPAGPDHPISARPWAGMRPLFHGGWGMAPTLEAVTNFLCAISLPSRQVLISLQPTCHGGWTIRRKKEDVGGELHNGGSFHAWPRNCCFFSNQPCSPARPREPIHAWISYTGPLVINIIITILKMMR